MAGMRFKLLLAIIGGGFAALLLHACSGGSGSAGTGQNELGLLLPKTINVLSPKTIQQQSNSKIASFVAPPDSDFKTDVARVYVNSNSLRPLVSADYTLCIFENVRYDEMVNKGPYEVTFDRNLCLDKSTSKQDPVKLRVLSTREDDKSPHIVKIWISDVDSEELFNSAGYVIPMNLYEAEIQESPSDKNVFGKFNIKAARVVDASMTGGHIGEEAYIWRSLMATVDNADQSPQITYLLLNGSHAPGTASYYFGSTQSANIVLDPTNSGAGYGMSRYSLDNTLVPSQNTDEETAFSFNTDNLFERYLRNTAQPAKQSACLSRNDFTAEVRGYNLYHTKERVFNGVSVKSGERVKIQASKDLIYNGQRVTIGQGIASQINIPDGAQLTSTDFSTSYTANVSPGRVYASIGHQATLESLKSSLFAYSGKHPIYSFNKNWVVKLSPTNEFVIIGIADTVNSTDISTTLLDHDNDSSTPPVDVTATIPLADGEDIYLSTPDVPAILHYVHNVNTPAQDRFFTYREENLITPNNISQFAPATGEFRLFCYRTCPKGGITQAFVDAAVSPQDLYYTYFQDISDPIVYRAVSESGKISLIDENNGLPVSLSGLDLSNLGMSYMNTSTLFLTPLSAVEQSAFQPLTFGASVDQHSNNSLVTLTEENGNLFVFEKALYISYRHDAANDVNNSDPATNPYQSANFYLTYFGPGYHLNLPTAVALKDGTELANGAYVTKATSTVHNLRETDISACDPLTARTENPELALPTEQNLRAISITRQDRPAGPLPVAGGSQ